MRRTARASTPTAELAALHFDRIQNMADRVDSAMARAGLREMPEVLSNIARRRRPAATLGGGNLHEAMLLAKWRKAAGLMILRISGAPDRPLRTVRCRQRFRIDLKERTTNERTARKRVQLYGHSRPTAATCWDFITAAGRWTRRLVSSGGRNCAKATATTRQPQGALTVQPAGQSDDDHGSMVVVADCTAPVAGVPLGDGPRRICTVRPCLPPRKDSPRKPRPTSHCGWAVSGQDTHASAAAPKWWTRPPLLELYRGRIRLIETEISRLGGSRMATTARSGRAHRSPIDRGEQREAGTGAATGQHAAD